MNAARHQMNWEYDVDAILSVHEDKHRRTDLIRTLTNLPEEIETTVADLVRLQEYL